MDLQPDKLKQLFRAKLKARRVEAGLSQSALAKMISSTQPYIADLESGKRSPTLETIAKLSEALEVAPEYFISQKLLQHSA